MGFFLSSLVEKDFYMHCYLPSEMDILILKNQSVIDNRSAWP